MLAKQSAAVRDRYTRLLCGYACMPRGMGGEADEPKEKAWQIVRRRPRPFTVTFGNLTLRGVSVGRERSGRSKALNDREESRGGREISFSVAWISCLSCLVCRVLTTLTGCAYARGRRLPGAPRAGCQ